MPDINSLDQKKLRYERKYRVDQVTLADVENIVRIHPAGFREAHPIRNVNNIYFDTLDKQAFIDNRDGIANRKKFRIRWYGELFGHITKPVLELKIKCNLVGKKYIYPLKSFDLQPSITIHDMHNVFKDSNLPELRKQEMLQLWPVLLNRYTRKYYISSDGQYRLTLDYNINYYRIQETNNSFLYHCVDRRSTIIELKYPPIMDSTAHVISQYFPYRLTKNSKYVVGVQWLYGR